MFCIFCDSSLLLDLPFFQVERIFLPFLESIVVRLTWHARHAPHGWGDLLSCPLRELVWIPFWLGEHSEGLPFHGAQEFGQHGIRRIYFHVPPQTNSGASIRNRRLGTPILPQLQLFLARSCQVLRSDLICRYLEVDALHCLGHVWWCRNEASCPIHKWSRWGCHQQWHLAWRGLAWGFYLLVCFCVGKWFSACR